MLIHDSFPLAQICLLLPQENATVPIDGFECFHSLGLKVGAASKIPGVGKGPFPKDTPCPRPPKPPPWKTWLSSFPPPRLGPGLGGAGACQGLIPGHGVWAQLEDQSLQMEQLRQELDARREELEQAQRSLSHAKQVRGWGAARAQIPSNPATGDGPATTAEPEDQQQPKELPQG